MRHRPVLSVFAIVVLAGLAAAPTAVPVAADAQSFYPTNTAVLRWLDKVTGRVTSIRAPVGQVTNISTLSIMVETCFTRPPEETPESAVFLKIWDTVSATPEQPVFSGWMYASSPSLSALDHGVYDVWVLDCEDNTLSSSE